MSTTYGQLKTRVATILQDPSAKTFTAGLVAELIKAGLIEVGRLAPVQFAEDITLVAGQLDYAVRSAAFSGAAVPEIELSRVEIWDPSQTPDALIANVQPASVEWANYDTGWSLWGGTLTLPTRVVKGVEGYEGTYVLRVRGYSPYVLPTSDSDVLETSDELTQAVLDYIRYEALQMLLASRDLFTQWQTRSGNTDMTPAGLMNQMNIAGDMWRRKARAITRLRAQV